MADAKIKVVSYARVSTVMQASKDFSSIDVQERIIKDYVASHPEYELVAMFADRGRSAKDMNRPAIRELMARIEKDDIRIVLSYRLDRISREKLSFYKFEDLLRSHGVRLIYTNDINFEDNPSGNLAKGVVIATAQYERETTSLRIRDKYREAIKAGYHAGGYAPIGYKIGDVKKSLIIEPDSAAVVKKIFAMFLSGEAPCEIAEHISATYGKTPVRISKRGKEYGGYPYTENLIRRILANPIYTGYVCYDDGDSRRFFEGRHEAIIPRNQWTSTQEKLKAAKSEPIHSPLEIRIKNPYLLKKLLFCSCGANMTVGGSGKKHKDGTPYLYYVCTRKQHERAACSCDTAIALNIIEDVVFSSVGYIATNEISVKDVKNANAEYKTSLENERETLRKKIEVADKSVQSALDKFALLGNDESIRNAISKNLREKTKLLEDMRLRLNEVNGELSAFRERIDLDNFQIKAAIENLDFCKDSLTTKQKEKILQATVAKLVLSVKNRKKAKRTCSLTILPKDNCEQPIVVEFTVDNSQGRGMWEVLAPFKLLGGEQAPKRDASYKRIKQHFLHEIVGWEKIRRDENLSIRELADRLGLKKSIVARKLKMLGKLSEDAIMYLLKMRLERYTKKVSFLKLEKIADAPSLKQVGMIKSLAGIA